MQKKLIFSMTLVYLLTACIGTLADKPAQPTLQTVSPAHSTHLLTPANYATAAQPTPASTATATRTRVPPTSSATPVSLEPITPEITRLCPEQPEVSLTKLGMRDKVLVVELYDKASGQKLSPSETGAVVVTFDNPIPQSIPNTTAKDGLTLVRYYPAADGQSIELVYEDPEERQRQVWRSSWDGQHQWKVEEYELEPLPDNQSRLELWDGKYLVYEWHLAYPAEGIYAHPLSMHDRKTGKVWQLPPFPDKTRLLRAFNVNGMPYLLYLEEKQTSVSTTPIETYRTTLEFAFYNLNTFTVMPLPWLSEKDAVDWLTTHFWYSDGLFSVLVARPYGLDLGLGLNLETLLDTKTYDEVMQAVHLPLENYLVNLFQGAYLQTRNGMVLLPQPKRDIPAVLYFLDFQDFRLRDYCYSIEDPRATDSYTSFAVSGNERFVAFTKAQIGTASNPGGKFIQGIDILDLDTGRFARLSDVNFGVIGWIRR